jgi:hypothetical protein
MIFFVVATFIFSTTAVSLIQKTRKNNNICFPTGTLQHNPFQYSHAILPKDFHEYLKVLFGFIE